MPTASRSPDITVVTHPLGASGENAARTLLDVLTAITTVSLVTARLPDESTIWDDHDVTEVTTEGIDPANVTETVARFLATQVKFCRAIGRADADVVLFFGATSYLLPILYARLLGRTVVLQPRGDVPLTLRLEWEQSFPALVARVLAGSVRALERAGYRIADAIVTYTPAMATELRLDCHSAKLHPHGARYVDTDAFAVQTPFEDRENVVGFVGRLDEEKRVRTLARAARKLSDDVTFRFVGEGPLRERLATIAADDPRIEFTGWVDHDEIPAHLNEFRLLVLPSRPTEGLPTTALEAMACGTPVLATPVAGVPDVVRDGETGFHLPRGQPSAAHLQRRITAALNDPRLHAISREAATLVRDRYGYEHAVERYTRILADATDASDE
jgi:glycosyltransferase involved in cell wall biosynthesis